MTVGSRVGGGVVEEGKRKETRRKEGIKEDDVMMMCREGRKEAEEERYAGIFALEGGLNSSSTETARCAQPKENDRERD